MIQTTLRGTRLAVHTGKAVQMPALPRSEWYDLTRDMNWNFSYVTDEQVFPEEMSESFGVPKEFWWKWDEPYKIT